MTNWRDEALCRQVDGNLWFPEKGASNKPAKRICNTPCPSRIECLDYALTTGQGFGVWGGLSAAERKDMGMRDFNRERRAERAARLVAGGVEIARIAEIIGVTERTVARDLAQIRREA